MSQRWSTATMKLESATRAVLDSLETRRLLSAANEVSTVTFESETFEAVTGQYVVAVRQNFNFLDLAQKSGFKDVRSLGGDDSFYVFKSSKTLKQLQKWYSNHPNVLAFAPDATLKPQSVPNDTYYQSSQYFLNNTGQQIPNLNTAPEATERQDGVVGSDIGAEAAWNITTGTDVVIAIMDSGVDVGHGDLAANIWVNPFEIAGNGVDDDGNGKIDDINGWNFGDDTADLTDTGGHGTAVAGSAAAVGNNNKGVAGVAYNAKIMGVKYEGSRATDNASIISIAIEGMNYVADFARKGVNVAAVNASFGFPQALYYGVFGVAIQRLTSAGVVFVGAAGNESLDNDRSIDFPTRYSQSTGLKGALAVAATDNQDNLAYYSNYGAATVQVAAPGTGIFTTYSRDAVGASLTDANGDTYISIDGTSFSSPIVAGVVALAKAAYPQATPEQIVQAVIDGVDVLPSLSGLSTNGPKKVTSGGRVNAYNTLRLLQNRLAGTNSVTQGNWRGSYGSVASFVYGGTTGTPTLGSFNTTTLTPANSAVVSYGKVKTTDQRPSQLPAAEGRSTQYLSSDDTLSLGFDFGTTTRRLTLYAADLGKRKTTQTVQVVDTSTGFVLQSVTMSDFRNGQYVSFDVTGQVSLNVVPTAGGSTIVNALYVDSTPTQQVAGTDKVTQGTWMRNYGDQGYILPGVGQSLPSGVGFSTNASVVAGRPTSNVLAPETVTSSKARSTSVFTAASTFNLNVTITDGTTRRISLYAYNASKTARIQRIEQLDASNNVIASADVSLSKSGQYVTFNVTTSATFRVTGLGGGAPSISGVFVSAIPTAVRASGNNATFTGSNSTLGGANYRGVYGNSGTYVVGASSTLPSVLGATLPTSNVSTSIVATNSKNAAALRNPNTLTGGIVGYLSTLSTTDIEVDTGTNGTTQLTAYFVDFDKKKRVQDVQIVDADTGEVLSSVRLRNFEKGTYLSWNVTGNVFLRISRVDGPSAVISGIFAD